MQYTTQKVNLGIIYKENEHALCGVHVRPLLEL